MISKMMAQLYLKHYNYDCAKIMVNLIFVNLDQILLHDIIKLRILKDLKPVSKMKI